MNKKQSPYLRCPHCDYSWGPPTGVQSNYFESLPREERQKRRYTVKHPRTGEVVLGCSDCFSFEMSEKERPTSKQLEEIANKILKDSLAAT